MLSHQKWSTVVSSDASTLLDSLPAVSLPGLVHISIPAQMYFSISSVFGQVSFLHQQLSPKPGDLKPIFVPLRFSSCSLPLSLCATYFSLPVGRLMITVGVVAPAPAPPPKPGELKPKFVDVSSNSSYCSEDVPQEF